MNFDDRWNKIWRVLRRRKIPAVVEERILRGSIHPKRNDTTDLHDWLLLSLLFCLSPSLFSLFKFFSLFCFFFLVMRDRILTSHHTSSTNQPDWQSSSDRPAKHSGSTVCDRLCVFYLLCVCLCVFVIFVITLSHPNSVNAILLHFAPNAITQDFHYQLH